MAWCDKSLVEVNQALIGHVMFCVVHRNIVKKIYSSVWSLPWVLSCQGLSFSPAALPKLEKEEEVKELEAVFRLVRAVEAVEEEL